VKQESRAVARGLAPGMLYLELKVIIERNYKGAEFNVQKLASEMQLNERSLHCLCKKHLAVSPSQMIRSFKINKVKSLLLNGIKSEEVAKEVGYNCKSSFQDAFKKEEGGVSPINFKLIAMK